MFIIFGFIIVGLSLVSMCINVIQLKLEELFEELLLAMMEEYDTQAGLAAPHMTPKMGMVDLWKMWKRRRRFGRENGNISFISEFRRARPQQPGF